MYCCECAQPIVRNANGSWPQCCRGFGYWSELKPLDCDRWWPLTKRSGLYFYPTPAYLKHLKEKEPDFRIRFPAV